MLFTEALRSVTTTLYVAKSELCTGFTVKLVVVAPRMSVPLRRHW